jgi:hypothetical protein
MGNRPATKKHCLPTEPQDYDALDSFEHTIGVVRNAHRGKIHLTSAKHQESILKVVCRMALGSRGNLPSVTASKSTQKLPWICGMLDNALLGKGSDIVQMSSLILSDYQCNSTTFLT